MTEPTPSEIALRDPLSEVTRKKRSHLLITSVIGITMVKTGLVPQKISALGVEFSSVNRNTLLYLVALIVVYFFSTFIIYSAADFIAWRLSIHMSWKDLFRRRKIGNKAKPSESGQATKEHFWGSRILAGLATPVSVIRALFEFLLPIIIGGCAISLLFGYKVP